MFKVVMAVAVDRDREMAAHAYSAIEQSIWKNITTMML